MGQLSRQKRARASRMAAATRMSEFAGSVPSDHLRQVAELRGLLSEWVRINGLANWFGVNLAARFGSGGGNPALDALMAGKTSKFAYLFTSAIVSWQDELFSCIQISWPYQRESFLALDDPPKNEIDLFFLILGEFYDFQLEQAIDGHSSTVRAAATRTNKSRYAFWAAGGGVEVDCDSIAALCNGEGSSLFWYSLAMGTIKDACKTDPPLQSQHRAYLKKFGDFIDLVHRRTTAELKGSIPPEQKIFQSTRIQDGVVKRGTKGGYRAVT